MFIIIENFEFITRGSTSQYSFKHKSHEPKCYHIRQDMNQAFFPVEDYIAHRGRMKLLDAVVDVDAQNAVVRSVTTEAWPLFEGGAIRPIVIVELVAQTAGINIRWEEMQESRGREKEGGGLLVGIKEAVFYVPRIRVDATVITSARKQYAHMNYAEYHGFSKIGGDILGEATIQVLRTD